MGSSSSTEGTSEEIAASGGESIVVGRLGRPNGLKGFLGIYVDAADLSHFEPGSEVTILGRAYEVRAIRRGTKGYEVAFDGVVDREGAEAIRGADVSVAGRRELAANEYWPSDLVGLSVRPGGGEIVDVVHGPSQDRLVIRRGDDSFEVPFVEELVPVVDIAGGFAEVVEIEGLSGH